jgi:hypothetical protein
MDPKRVAMWCVMAGGPEVPADLRSKAKDPDWWQALEDTPEESLSVEQQRMLSALGANLSSLPPDERD